MLDGLVLGDRVLAVCMPVLLSASLIHGTFCCYQVSQNIVTVAIEGYAWATGMYEVSIIHGPLPVIGPMVM